MRDIKNGYMLLEVQNNDSDNILPYISQSLSSRDFFSGLHLSRESRKLGTDTIQLHEPLD
jgi:hypothetical protein